MSNQLTCQQIARLKKAYEPLRDTAPSSKGEAKLKQWLRKFIENKDILMQLFAADIPHVSDIVVDILEYDLGMTLGEMLEYIARKEPI